MPRTWADTAAVLRELASRCRTSPSGVAGAGRHRPGRRHLADRRATASPSAPAWLWLDSPRRRHRRASWTRSGVRERGLSGTPAAASTPATSRPASALAASRHAARAARARRDRAPLQGLALLQPDRRARHRCLRGHLHLRRLPHPRLRARASWTRSGSPTSPRLLPPMLDGSRTTHPLTAEAAAATGPAAEDCRSCSAISTCSAPALGAGLYEPGRAVGCSIVGSTGMHMRLCRDADLVELGARADRLHHAVPGARQRRRRCSRTWRPPSTSTGWSTSRARRAEPAGATTSPTARPCCALDARVLDARPAAALYHPYIHEAGERGPFVDVNARAQFTGLSSGVGFLDLVRAVYEGLAFAARDCYARHGPPAGGDPRSPAAPRARRRCKTILASALGAPVRDSRARGGRCRRCRDDGRRRDRPLSRPGGRRRTWVDPLLGEVGPARPGRWRAIYDRLFPVYVADPRRRCRRSGRDARRGAARRSHCMTEIAIIGDRFMLPDAFVDGAARGWSAPSSPCAPWSCPGRTSRWSTATPRPGLAGLKEYQGDPDAIADFVGDAADPGRPSGAGHRRRCWTGCRG